MKIAIIGQDVEGKRKIIDDFMGRIQSYGMPSASIYDESVDFPENVKIDETFNEIERELYMKMTFLDNLYEKYHDKDKIIYDGCSIDVLASTLNMLRGGLVSEDFWDKMVYWNKKLLSKLDMVYWFPSADNYLKEEELKETESKITELSEKEGNDEEVEKLIDTVDAHYLEVIYNNFWEDYIHNFDKSDIYPQDCPGIGVFESATQGDELFFMVDDLDNDDKSNRLDDIQKLNDIIKDKKLLKMMKEALSESTIPLPSGERVTTGSIKI